MDVTLQIPLPHQCVLYTNDLEPITILELSPHLRDHLMTYGNVTLPIQEPVRLLPHDGLEPIVGAGFRTVRIVAERLRFRNRASLLLFTADEESALLIKPAFLPGQQNELTRIRHQSFAEGFGAAFLEMCRLWKPQ